MSSRYALIFCLLGACSTRSHNLASSLGSDASTAQDASLMLCGASDCVCANGLDDDGDGLIDGFDPECTSATDQFEDSFATGVHGEDQTQKCQDCFFDDNSGRGDDGCSRAHSCALDGTSTSGTGACKACTVEPMCSDTCAPLAPNGCDCFGCCGVWRDGQVTNILLSDTCSVRELDDVTKCTRCVPAPDCLNPCGPCELCAGRTLADLPSGCTDAAGPGYACDQSALCRSSDDCGADQYCQQGCCLLVAI